LDEVEACLKVFDMHGNYLQHVSHRGAGPGELSYPRGLFIMPDGRLGVIAPSKQGEVVDHVKGQPVPEKRNVMIESARITRGDMTDAARIRAGDIDALIIPGGMGAAMNLSNFVRRGSGCTVDPTIGNLIARLNDAKKPIGAMCIAPATLAAALRDIDVTGVKMTIGNDPETAAKIEEMEQVHVECPVDDCVIDEEHKIVTTPAYMLGESIKDIQAGIDKLVKIIFDMA